MNDSGQTTVEYVFLVLMIASVVSFFYKTYGDQLVGEQSFIRTLIDDFEFGEANFKRFKLYR